MSRSIDELLHEVRGYTNTIEQTVELYNKLCPVETKEGFSITTNNNTPIEDDPQMDALHKWADAINARSRAKWDARLDRELIRKIWSKDSSAGETLAKYKAQLDSDKQLSDQVSESMVQALAAELRGAADFYEINLQTSDKNITEGDDYYKFQAAGRSVRTPNMASLIFAGDIASNAVTLSVIESLLDGGANPIADVQLMFSQYIAGAKNGMEKQKSLRAGSEPGDRTYEEATKLVKLLQTDPQNTEIGSLFTKLISDWEPTVTIADQVASEFGRVLFALDSAEAIKDIYAATSTPEETAGREEELAILTTQYREATFPVPKFVGETKLMKRVLELLKAEWQTKTT